MKRVASTPARRRRGSLLFEVLLSLALFVTAASFSIGATRSVLGAVDRSRRQAMATDLARAKMAELEAGLTSIADLRDDRDGITRVGSIEELPADGPSTTLAETVWRLEVDSARTEFVGLTLVTITVTEDRADAGLEGAGASFTLRQLVALRDDDAEAYEEDEMLRGLPEATTPEDRP